MDKVLYLLHTTSQFDIKFNELKPSSTDDINHQFPGVYFSIITKNNLEDQELFSNKNLLIFSKRLLEQENYHINIRDYNGFINEKNTYFPWNLNKAIKKINMKKNTINEIIFHDPISFKYLCLNISVNIDIDVNKLLPKIEIYNNEEPDKTKIPFYCYPLEDNYSGVNKYKLSSINFYKKMGILCNIDTNKTREKIIEDIKDKMLYYYNNREKQNLLEFKKLSIQS
jgi:hypothetical protein